MATLVLTAVGQVFGGPIGAAIGSLIGQTIDREVLFKQKGRDGPRLTELAVQTSSYGTPIQLVFGMMRVGGSVIWSTELVESRSSSRQGKGQPTTTEYSYSVSFAVALSGRPIERVGRIWADGKLLRGVAGDFKTATGFRLYTGGEDQPVDALIAAAEGANLSPAYRGVAYAVFEDFQLADYGNRIPQLTFEVIADAAAVPIGRIAAAVSGGIVDGAGIGQVAQGFAAYGQLRSVLEMLGSASGATFVPEGAGLRMAGDAASPLELADEGYMAGERGGTPRVRSVAAIDTIAQTVSLAHYDPARDYQTGLQRARRPGPGLREERIELPAALDADSAKTIAGDILARAEASRERRTVMPGWHALAVLPGARVTIAGSGGVWRVAEWSLEGMVLKLDCVGVAGASVVAHATPGRVAAAADRLPGATILHAFETPALDDVLLAAPRVTIAAAGTGAGWRRAAVLYSLDGGARWTAAGATRGVATIGTVAVPPGAGPTDVFDAAGRLEVDLLHGDMLLQSADDAALIGGANVALVGRELLQFGRAEQIGAVRWRLSRLVRGRRGTEAAIGRQDIGDRFVVIDVDATSVIDLPLAAIGSTVRIMATGIGDGDGPAMIDLPIDGTSVRPPSPVHLNATVAGDGSVTIRWVRRSRSGWRWIDGVDAPVGEEREAYRVSLSSEGAATRNIEVAEPGYSVTAAARGGATLHIGIRQIGLCGESDVAEITLPPPL